MAIAKMKLITISAEKEHLLDVLQKFIDLDYFHPEPASKFIDSVHGLSSMDEENPVAELSARNTGQQQKGGGRHGKDHDRQQWFCGIREYHYSEDS